MVQLFFFNSLLHLSYHNALLNCKFISIYLQTLLLFVPSPESRKIKKIFNFFSTKNMIRSCKRVLRLGIIKGVSYAVSFFLTSLNIVLIMISNMSMLNPGPPSSISELSVHYQNVQGFVIHSTLGSEYPSLNLTKIFEFQSHISLTKPDVIVLNETWLSRPFITMKFYPLMTIKYLD